MPNIEKDVIIKSSSASKQSYVVAGAIISCNKGSKLSRLKMDFSHGVYIKGMPQMNIKDHVPNINIFPFGKCSSLQNPTVAAATAANNGKLTPMPCTPVTTIPWIDGKYDKLVDGHPALLDKSTLPCLYCGTIKIEDDGQYLNASSIKAIQEEFNQDQKKQKMIDQAAGLIPDSGNVAGDDAFSRFTEGAKSFGKGLWDGATNEIDQTITFIENTLKDPIAGIKNYFIELDQESDEVAKQLEEGTFDQNMIKEYSDKVDEIDSLISEGDWEGAGGIVGGFIVQKGIERLGGNKRNPNRDNDNPQNNALESLSRAQKRNLETLDNIVDNHLTDMDFSGTLRDLQGDPVPKPGGGYWNHLQEMKDSYKGLRKIKRGLEGSLQNPNLPQDTRKVLETALDKASVNLKKIEDLFEPFGGLDND